MLACYFGPKNLVIVIIVSLFIFQPVRFNIELSKKLLNFFFCFYKFNVDYLYNIDSLGLKSGALREMKNEKKISYEEFLEKWYELSFPEDSEMYNKDLVTQFIIENPEHMNELRKEFKNDNLYLHKNSPKARKAMQTLDKIIELIKEYNSEALKEIDLSVFEYGFASKLELMIKKANEEVFFDQIENWCNVAKPIVYKYVAPLRILSEKEDIGNNND